MEADRLHLTPTCSQWGYVQVRDGKSRNGRRAVPLTRHAHDMLEKRQAASEMRFVFADEHSNVPGVSSLDHLHAKTRQTLMLSPECVRHSLRHTYLPRLGLAGVKAFTIMKLAGHSSVTVASATFTRRRRRWKMQLQGWTT